MGKAQFHWFKASLMGCVGWLALYGASVPIASGQTDASSATPKISELAQQQDTSSENEISVNTIQGELNSSSEAIENDGYYQIHTLEGEAGQQIAIELISSEFDSYLILFDPEGNKIAENDDGGEGKNAKIVTTLPTTGRYQIMAKTYKAGETGTYELRWREATEEDRKLAEAHRLNQQVIELLQQGQYEEAIPLAERALAIRQQVLGEEHVDVATSLNNLALLYQRQGRYDQAEPLYQQALEMEKRLLGEQHPRVASSLNNLAGLYESQGRYDQAEPLFRQALEMRKRLLGEQHPDVAQSLNNLAGLYKSQGRYDQAEPLYQQALEMRKRLWGEQHPDVAQSLNNLASLYESQGRYDQAEPLFRQALEMFKSLLGEHPHVATSLNNLAFLYQRQGRYDQAESLFRQALEMRKRLWGEQHPHVADSLNNLAELYRSQGRYDEAEPLYQQALEMRKRLLGEQHPRVAQSLNNLAGLYKSQGRYDEAEPLYQQALEMNKSLLGEQHPRVAASLNNLAALYESQGRYDQAESLLRQALEMRKRLLGEQHPRVATSLNNLAFLYQRQGRYDQAEPLYQQALEMRKHLLGEQHPDVAASLNNLAALYESQGRYDQAEPLYQQALDIAKRLLGEQHPHVAASLNNLARLSWSQGELTQARNFLRRGTNLEAHNLRRLLTVGSERQKQNYMATIADTTHKVLSLHLQATPNNSDAARLALTAVLRRKGRILDAVTDNLQTLRQNLTPENQELLDQLADTRSQLATLLFQGVGNRSPEAYRQQIANLKAKANELENTLSYRSAEFRSKIQPVTIESIQQAIPEDAALLEFVRYFPYNPQDEENRWGEPRYAVYILEANGGIQWQDLGEAEPIDTAIQKFRQALQSRNPNIQQVARQLDEKIMQPIRPLLGNHKHLLISADSQLNLIPFAALVDENNRYLVRDYQMTYLGSGRDLLEQEQTSASESAPVLLANPNYDQAENVDIADAGSKNRGNRRSMDLADLQFGSLPGTAKEAKAIASLFPNIALLTESKATEHALKQVDSPSILHIATHGFFLENVEQVAAPNFGDRSNNSDRSLQVPPDPNAIGQARVTNTENPLLRSGLALAGFNNRQQQKNRGEDGVFTALEASGLDLYGTQLVVLSACDTGVGEVKNGEGVYGLRRAFAMAGAQSQLISLWKVSDDGTQQLMTRYYQRLLDNQGRSVAYRQTQLEMLESQKYDHPFFWAAFILSGDWTPLK